MVTKAKAALPGVTAAPEVKTPTVPAARPGQTLPGVTGAAPPAEAPPPGVKETRLTGLSPAELAAAQKQYEEQKKDFEADHIRIGDVWYKKEDIEQIGVPEGGFEAIEDTEQRQEAQADAEAAREAFTEGYEGWPAGPEAYEKWFEGNTVLLATGERVDRDTYEEMPTDVQKKLYQLGTEKFRDWAERQEKVFEVRTVNVGTEDEPFYVGKSFYQDLNQDEKRILEDVIEATGGAEGWEDQFKAQYEAHHQALWEEKYAPIAGDQWIERSIFDPLTRTEKDILQTEGIPALEDFYQGHHFVEGRESISFPGLWGREGAEFELPEDHPLRTGRWVEGPEPVPRPDREEFERVLKQWEDPEQWARLGPKSQEYVERILWQAKESGMWEPPEVDEEAAPPGAPEIHWHPEPWKWGGTARQLGEMATWARGQARPTWRTITPWQEELGETVSWRGGAVMAGELVLPGYYAARHWKTLGTAGRAFAVGADVLSVIPIFGAAGRVGIATRTMATAQKAALRPGVGRGLRSIGYLTEQTVVGAVATPGMILRHPIRTAKELGYGFYWPMRHPVQTARGTWVVGTGRAELGTPMLYTAMAERRLIPWARAEIPPEAITIRPEMAERYGLVPEYPIATVPGRDPEALRAVRELEVQLATVPPGTKEVRVPFKGGELVLPVPPLQRELGQAYLMHVTPFGRRWVGRMTAVRGAGGEIGLALAPYPPLEWAPVTAKGVRSLEPTGLLFPQRRPPALVGAEPGEFVAGFRTFGPGAEIEEWLLAPTVVTIGRKPAFSVYVGPRRQRMPVFVGEISTTEEAALRFRAGKDLEAILSAQKVPSKQAIVNLGEVEHVPKNSAAALEDWLRTHPDAYVYGSVVEGANISGIRPNDVDLSVTDPRRAAQQVRDIIAKTSPDTPVRIEPRPGRKGYKVQVKVKDPITGEREWETSFDIWSHKAHESWQMKYGLKLEHEPVVDVTGIRAEPLTEQATRRMSALLSFERMEDLERFEIVARHLIAEGRAEARLLPTDARAARMAELDQAEDFLRTFVQGPREPAMEIPPEVIQRLQVEPPMLGRQLAGTVRESLAALGRAPGRFRTLALGEPGAPMLTRFRELPTRYAKAVDVTGDWAERMVGRMEQLTWRGQELAEHMGFYGMPAPEVGEELVRVAGIDYYYRPRYLYPGAGYVVGAVPRYVAGWEEMRRRVPRRGVRPPYEPPPRYVPPPYEAGRIPPYYYEPPPYYEGYRLPRVEPYRYPRPVRAPYPPTMYRRPRREEPRPRLLLPPPPKGARRLMIERVNLTAKPDHPTKGNVGDPLSGGLTYYWREYDIDAISQPVYARPMPGYKFSHWTGDLPRKDVKKNPVEVVMDKDKEIEAVFVREVVRPGVPTIPERERPMVAAIEVRFPTAPAMPVTAPLEPKPIIKEMIFPMRMTPKRAPRRTMQKRGAKPRGQGR